MTTVLWAGSEDVDFAFLAGAAADTNAAHIRNTFVRAGLLIASASTAFPVTTNIAITPQFTAQTSLWAHGRLSNGNNNVGPNAGDILFALADPGGLARIAVVSTAVAGQVRLCTVNSAGTITTLVTSAGGVIPPSGSVPLAFDLFVNYTATGQVQLNINGAAVADTGTGVNVVTAGATTLGAALFGSIINGATNITWSEMIVQDTSTLGMALQSLPPIAAGNTQAWTPNTVANVNPTTINDANFVSTAAVNTISQWTVATTLPAGTWTIAAVKQSARVLVGATGPLHYEWNVRTVDGTDHVVGSVAPLTSFGNAGVVWMTNPHTGAAWNAGELINAGIESLT